MLHKCKSATKVAKKNNTNKLITKIMKRFQIILNEKCIKDFNTFGGAFNYLVKKLLEINEESEIILYDSYMGKIKYEIYKH